MRAIAGEHARDPSPAWNSTSADGEVLPANFWGVDGVAQAVVGVCDPSHSVLGMNGTAFRENFDGGRRPFEGWLSVASANDIWTVPGW